MDVPLRLMLTAKQSQLIRDAAEHHGTDVSAWARPILLEAARNAVGPSQMRKRRTNG
jgi:uncharacterized protein (DUF1778 family)